MHRRRSQVRARQAIHRGGGAPGLFRAFPRQKSGILPTRPETRPARLFPRPRAFAPCRGISRRSASGSDFPNYCRGLSAGFCAAFGNPPSFWELSGLAGLSGLSGLAGLLGLLLARSFRVAFATHSFWLYIAFGYTMRLYPRLLHCPIAFGNISHSFRLWFRAFAAFPPPLYAHTHAHTRVFIARVLSRTHTRTYTYVFRAFGLSIAFGYGFRWFYA